MPILSFSSCLGTKLAFLHSVCFFFKKITPLETDAFMLLIHLHNKPEYPTMEVP